MPSKKRSEAIADGLKKCSAHFGAEITEENAKIYRDGLRELNAAQIESAFKRCLKECQFMPKLQDVLRRTPEAEVDENYNRVARELIKRECGDTPTRWTETAGNLVYHYIGSPDKKSRWVEKVERVSAGPSETR